MIVEPNWGAFSAKFNGKEQKAFEWFCSLLFSKEHRHASSLSQTDDLASQISQAIWDDPELREYVDELLAEDEAETHEGPEKSEPRAQPSKVDTTTLSQRDYAREEQEDFDACYEMAMRELTAEAEASEATIKPGRDWSEPT